jgi:hypothetical protein
MQVDFVDQPAGGMVVKTFRVTPVDRQIAVGARLPGQVGGEAIFDLVVNRVPLIG